MVRTMLVVFAALLLVSCSSAVRYSPSEINSYPPDMQEHIKKGEVALGMTPLQVRYTWGGPNSVRIPGAGSDGKFREIWIYTKARIFATRLIFTDGKLTGIISGLAKRKPMFEKDERSGDEEDVSVKEKETQ